MWSTWWVDDYIRTIPLPKLQYSRRRGRSPGTGPGPSKPNEHFLPGVALFYNRRRAGWTEARETIFAAIASPALAMRVPACQQ